MHRDAYSIGLSYEMHIPNTDSHTMLMLLTLTIWEQSITIILICMVWCDYDLTDLMAIGSVIYCNAFSLIWSEQKWQTCYLFRWQYPVKILIWAIFQRYRLESVILKLCEYPHRWLTATHQNIRFICTEEPCQCTTHVKKITPQITAIEGFKQRWWQRGKTYGLHL